MKKKVEIIFSPFFRGGRSEKKYAIVNQLLFTHELDKTRDFERTFLHRIRKSIGTYIIKMRLTYVSI